MDIQKALARNLVLRTEYGAGPRVLGGLLSRTVFNRRRYMLDGRTADDKIYESQVALGPLSLVHRCAEANPFGAKDFEVAVAIFKLFTVYTNDKDLFVKLKPGVSAGALKALLTLAPPAGLLAEAFDVDLAARAGLRLNLSGLIRDLRRDSDDDLEEEDETPDLS